MTHSICPISFPFSVDFVPKCPLSQHFVSPFEGAGMDPGAESSFKEETESEDLVPLSGLERNCETNSTCGGTVLLMPWCVS